MTYTKHDEWADSLYNSEDVASPGVADMIAERLNAQADEIERLERLLMNALAHTPPSYSQPIYAILKRKAREKP